MGTPDFAVASLEALIYSGIEVSAVITAPDKPAGRGLKLQKSPVKIAAENHGITVLQPEKLKSDEFIEKLRGLKPDLGVVVAFRMLPELVWKLPRLGTINLHASLLPDYRGAAPINRAIMNGEKESGLSTFFLRSEIDTGPIILQEKIGIGPNETAGELHDRMMHAGAMLLTKTVQRIATGDYSETEQSIEGATKSLKAAPKLFRTECRIPWSSTEAEVHNHIRGLSPYPGAWTELTTSESRLSIKVLKSERAGIQNLSPGEPLLSNEGLCVGCGEGSIRILELQAEGKRRMGIIDFLRGNNIPTTSRFV